MSEFGSGIPSDAELVKQMSGLGAHVEDARAALAADPPAVHRVFETMLANVFRIPSSWLQPFLSYPSDLEAPETFDESVSDWNFYEALKDCLIKIGVTNFRWKDLYEPSPKQVKRHMSTIIHFARFCEWQEGKAVAIDEQFASVVEQNDELKENLEQLRREYEVSCGDQDDKEARHLELEQMYAEENSKLLSLSHDVESLANANERAAQAGKQVEQQLRSMQAKRDATQEVLQELRANLCEDQDQLLAELAKEKQLTEKCQQEIAAAGKQRSFYAKWTCDAREYENDVVKTVRLLDETLVAQENEEDLKRQLEDAVEAVQVAEAAKAAMTEARESTLKELQQVTEEYERERARMQADQGSAAAVLDCGQKQHEHALARVEMLQERTAEATAEAAAAAGQLQEVARARDELNAKCEACYADTEASVRELVLRTCSCFEAGLRRIEVGGVAEEMEEDAAIAANLMTRLAKARAEAESLLAGHVVGAEDSL
eukprot:jgi/Ulvmu1/961/UM102_0044.1